MYIDGVRFFEKFHIHAVSCPFLEFWKRRQFQLQYEWDTLGFEATEVCAHYYSRYTLILS